MTTENSQPTDAHWADCPSGEIGSLVKDLQARRQQVSRRETFRQVAVGVTSLAILVMAGVYAVPHFGLAEPDYGGITCTEVKRLADEYIAGRLDGGVTARIDAHLAACDHCHSFMSELRDEPLPPSTAETVGQPHSFDIAEPTSFLALNNR